MCSIYIIVSTLIFIVTELIKGGPYIGPEVSIIFIGVNTNYTD